MSDFDLILDQVLSENANVDPPVGIERRLIAVLSSTAKTTRARRRFWLEAVAAAVVIGCSLTWMHLHHGTGHRVLAHPGQALASDSAIREMPDKKQGFSQAQRRERLVATVFAERRSERHLQIRAIQVAPLEVEPLVIPSIEVASLTPNNSGRKGEIR